MNGNEAPPKLTVDPPRRSRIVAKRLKSDSAPPLGAQSRTAPRKSSFRKSDVWRAISAAQKGGANVTCVEIGRDGSLRLLFNQPEKSNGSQDHASFDEWADRL